MRTDYKIVAHDALTGESLYQLEIKSVNGKPLLIGPVARLNDNKAVHELIKLADVVAGIQEPVYKPVRQLLGDYDRREWLHVPHEYRGLLVE